MARALRHRNAFRHGHFPCLPWVGSMPSVPSSCRRQQASHFLAIPFSFDPVRFGLPFPSDSYVMVNGAVQGPITGDCRPRLTVRLLPDRDYSPSSSGH